MFDKIVTYCKSNLPLVCIAIVCLALIVISIVLLCVKKSKAKKQKTTVMQTETAKTETKTETPIEKTEAPVENSVATQSKEASSPSPKTEENKEIKDEPRVSPTKTKKSETVAPVTTPVSPVQKEKNTTAKTVTPEKKTVKKATDKAASENTAVKADAPTAKKTEQAAEQKKTQQRKSARYAGKWVICRVVTATHAAGNVNDEGADEMFFFELRASNGEKLLTSEEYTTYAGALSGINTHKTNIEKGNFRITLSKKGDYLFKLLNGKNMLLCMGEHYATRASCESAIESAKRFASTAVIDENVQDIVIPDPVDEEDIPPTEFDENILGKWIVHESESEDGEKVYYFELYASNGEKLLSSEEYTTYAGAVNGIETHKTNIEKGNFRVSFTKRGDYIYKLLNGNNQLLCLGEHYKTRRRCESAIESVKRFSKVSPVLADPKTNK